MYKQSQQNKYQFEDDYIDDLDEGNQDEQYEEEFLEEEPGDKHTADKRNQGLKMNNYSNASKAQTNEKKDQKSNAV